MEMIIIEMLLPMTNDLPYALTSKTVTGVTENTILKWQHGQRTDTITNLPTTETLIIRLAGGKIT